MLDKNRVFFIERLTVPVILFYFLPLYFKVGFMKAGNKPYVFWVDASKLGILFIRIFSKFGCDCEKLNFRLVDIHDENGNLTRLRIGYKDLGEVRDAIFSREFFRKMQKEQDFSSSCLIPYLQKSSVVFLWSESNTILRMLFLINVIDWKLKNMDLKEYDAYFISDNRFFKKELYEYSHNYNIESIFTVFSPVSVRLVLQKLFGELRLKTLYYFVRSGVRYIIQKIKHAGHDVSSIPKVLVEFYGSLNLDHPERFSDLFFMQNSKLKGKNVAVSFNIPADPLTEKNYRSLLKREVTPVALNPSSSRAKDVPLFLHYPRFSRGEKNRVYEFIQSQSDKEAARWARCASKSFILEKDYWFELFKKFNIKVFLSWYNCGPRHCSISEALRCIGGVCAIYQRSFEEFPAAELTTFSDINFGFSKISAEAERQSGSRIPYYVIAGYIGDFRFPLLKETALKVRSYLLSNGAKKVMAYFDENSGDDSRFHTGHEFMRQNYSFLLRKIIETPWLGVVLKPKAPYSLKLRLGPVSELYEKALETGRCYVFDEGIVHGSFPPTAAALAGDIAVHGHLCAATAGIESALSGTPTLLLDREGWPMGSLNRLGRDVVFNNWSDLWEACDDHWTTLKGNPRLGNWSSHLDDFDPFRDRRAAQRLGNYLDNIVNGFEKGEKREDVLSFAAEQYAKIWGKDKVFSINC